MSNLLSKENISISSFLLYSVIVLTLSFFAVCSQSKITISNCNNKCKLYRRFNFKSYLISCLGACFFSAFTSVGIDRKTYGDMFIGISWGQVLNGWQEPGFNIFMLIIKCFTNNPAVFLAVFASLTVAMVYIAIWQYRNKLSVGLAVFIYLSQFYFQSFNLMRIYFAMAILLIGSKWLLGAKPIKYLLVLFVAVMIHYSVAIVMIPYGIYMLLRLKRRKNITYRWMFFSICIAVLLVLIGFFIASNYEKFNNAIIKKFVSYFLEVQINDIGFKWIFDCLPFVAILILCIQLSQRNSAFLNKSFFYLSVAYFAMYLAICILSYSIPVIGRSSIVLNLPIIIILPMVIESTCKDRMVSHKKIRFGALSVTNNQLIICAVTYFFLVLYIYLFQYLFVDGIAGYTFIWNNYLW
ncbi:MAG: EpsG family protein [Clostridia bacterium]|nr:EpsG family protein [Clostridia bacterium]